MHDYLVVFPSEREFWPEFGYSGGKFLEKMLDWYYPARDGQKL